MVKHNKIAWMESQYLFPHHFQQQERYIEATIEHRAKAIRPFVWGFEALEIDASQLNEQRISLARANGIMTDGCPFDLPHNAPLPQPVLVDQQVKNELVYLVLPIYQAGSRYIENSTAGEGVARYRLQELEVFDYCSDNNNAEQVESATLQFRLALEHENLGGFTCLPIAKISEVTQEGAIILDKKFIPPVLCVNANPILQGYLSDIIGMLHQRGDLLSHRFNTGTQDNNSAAIADFMLLQLINGAEPALRHLDNIKRTHPETLYSQLVTLSGELATFTTKSKRPIRFEPYKHNNLYQCYLPIIETLSKQLSVVLEQTAVSLPIEKRQYGIYVSRITDRSLLSQSRFILAAKANVSTDQLRAHLPKHVKIGSVETIRDLVNNQLTGITLTNLAMAPREISYTAGFVYFELDAHGDQWQSLNNSGGFAFHIAGDLPELAVEFWAIRN